MIKHWQFRAIDAQLHIVNGTAQAPSFMMLSVNLRQKGLQIIEAVQIQPDQIMANNRLQAMKQMVEPNHEPISHLNTSNWIQRFIRLLSGK